MKAPEEVDKSNQDKVDDLLREIREIWAQYKIEVPKQRRPWPRSINEKVIEQWRLRVNTHTIGAEAGLPMQTMYLMRQNLKKSDLTFLPVPIIRHRHSKGTPGRSLQL